jgi:hypothetical protein
LIWIFDAKRDLAAAAEMGVPAWYYIKKKAEVEIRKRLLGMSESGPHTESGIEEIMNLLDIGRAGPRLSPRRARRRFPGHPIWKCEYSMLPSSLVF